MEQSQYIKAVGRLALISASLLLLTMCSFSTLAHAQADTSEKKIALSNNYAGNAWRQLMVTSWQNVTSRAISNRIIAAADVFTTAENQASQQAEQIRHLSTLGYDAIVVNSASLTALNDAIRAACEAGIIVVSFDGTVSEPCAWRISIDFEEMGRRQIEYLAKKMPKGGNLLEIRGMEGVSIDQEIHDGITEAVKGYPQFNIVASIYGDWTKQVTRDAVLKVLPQVEKIDAVLTQGGDAYGAVLAFNKAKRPVPIVALSNREDELAWWKGQKDKSGYETSSASIAPGASTFAFWIAQMILSGEDIPKDITMPLHTISQETLEFSLKQTPKGGVANIEYSIDAVRNLLNEQRK